MDLDSLRRILALIVKELLAILKDPRSRYTVFVPPTIQLLVFGYAATYDLSRVRYAACDQDRSAASRQFLASLEGSGTFLRVANLESAEEIQPWIDARKALAVVQIPRDFERNLLAGRHADVQVIVDGRNSNTAGTALNYIGTITDSFNVAWNREHQGVEPPIRIESRAWYNPNLETRWFMIPGLLGMLVLIQVIIITAMSVAREREQGTFDQLLVTPFRPFEIMIGKALPGILVGMVQATFVVFVARFWFGIPFNGSLGTLYTGIFIFLLSAVGMGLMISSLVNTMQQALLGAFVIVMPCSLLSGLGTPISNMPQAVQYLTLINPLRYAISVTHRVFLEGAPFHLILPELIPMGGIALVTLSVAVWMFRHKLT
jgi:ABC-2 type transport system permease protein